MNINKFKALSVAVCCLVAALWSEPKCMEDEKAMQQVFFRSSLLSLASKGLTDDAVCGLASHIKGSTYITQIDLNHNTFGDPGIKSLASVLNTIPNLSHLSIYGSCITDLGFSDLCSAVERSPNIIFLDLRETMISNTGMIMLNDLCIKRPKLTFHCTFKNISQDFLIKCLTKKDSETPK